MIFTKRLSLFSIIFCMAVLVGPARPAWSAEDEPANASALTKLSEALRFDLRILGSGMAEQPSDSSQNPDNRFLQIPRYSADMEFRPDLFLTTDVLDLQLKPRLLLTYQTWEEGVHDPTQAWDNEQYINEWLARWKAREDLFASYGRENLQWGPSYLYSPSNPFFLYNGRRNPYQEVPGMDFGRVVWVAGSAWTGSFIANTNEGRNEINGPGPFEKVYALKVDYQGGDHYESMILSHRENGENSLGFYGGLTASDAVLLYAEGALVQGINALYPQADTSPFGASMQRIYEDDPAIQPVILMGSAYTFEDGGTLTAEYTYYGPGYDGAEADRYNDLKQKAAEAYSAAGPISLLSRLTLSQTINTGLRLLRRNYALLQYTKTNIKDRIDLTLRWTQNLDDGSGQATAVASYMLGDHFQLFTVATVGAGSKDTEFKTLVDYQWMIGLQYTY
ncbi:MAG: hypothetical protein M0036_19305 [Desulfobacteraceae bacterium]|nr:hypothetical protein [Desulfobacteraceae bacterium]